MKNTHLFQFSFFTFLFGAVLTSSSLYSMQNPTQTTNLSDAILQNDITEIARHLNNGERPNFLLINENPNLANNCSKLLYAALMLTRFFNSLTEEKKEEYMETCEKFDVDYTNLLKNNNQINTTPINTNTPTPSKRKIKF